MRGAAAAVTSFTSDTDQSRLEFIGIQAGAEFKGVFHKFTANVDFAPEALASSRIDVQIDMNSVDSNDKDRDTTIRGKDVFDVAHYPTAHYITKSITKTAAGFSAVGALTLHGVTKDVPIADAGKHALMAYPLRSFDVRQRGAAVHGGANAREDAAPLLGGTPAVWKTCMVFFQAALLAGYLYAHAAMRWMGRRTQIAVHVAVVAAALLVLPLYITPSRAPAALENPVRWILITLAATVGLPFFALAASTPILQKWFAGTSHKSAEDPYFSTRPVTPEACWACWATRCCLSRFSHSARKRAFGAWGLWGYSR